MANDKNNNKDTYDKLIGGETNIFSEIGFDEMQTAKNHEIGFKLFRTFFYVALVFSIVVTDLAVGIGNLQLTIIGFTFMGTCVTFFLIYAAKTSAAGVMNLIYARTMGKKSTFLGGTAAMLVLFVLVIISAFNISNCIMWAMVFILQIGSCTFARRNMKVLEKMLKDNDDEFQEAQAKTSHIIENALCFSQKKEPVTV